MSFKKHELKAIETATSEIVKDITKHLSIDEIAFKAGIGGTKLKSLFAKFHKMGMYAYLKKKRMEHALFLLTETETEIKIIAQQCGFESVEGFHTAFKQYYHRTPASYRGTTE